MATDNEYRHIETERRLQWLEEHYSQFNSEFGEVKTDVKWLVKFYWVIMGTSTGAFITAVFNLIIK